MKNTSEKQIRANRINAKKWGVKTVEGKNTIKKNAIKHGLTSSMIINKEEKDIFDNIFKVLLEELNPENFLEEMLVERIALNYMKLQRVVRFDTKQVLLEKYSTEKDFLKESRPQEPESHIPMIDLWEPQEDNQEDKRKRMEIDNQISNINERIKELEKSHLSQTSIDVFERIQRYETMVENRLYKGIKEYYRIKGKL